MNKYEFISNFLENEKLNPSQKERLLKLIVSELNSDGVNQNEIEKRIRKVEEILNLKNFTNWKRENTSDSQPKTDLPEEYIEPIQLSQFLKAYNQHPLLKYTCHEIDSDGLHSINEKCGTDVFNFEKYHELISISFKELSNRYKIPQKIFALINGYLNGGAEWSADNIKINWKSRELIYWCKSYPDSVPNPNDELTSSQNDNFGFEFSPFKSAILGTTIGSFSQLVIHFKHLFHVKMDNPLKKMIINVNATNNWNEKIKFNTDQLRQNVEFFSDIDKLLQAYQKIINIIINVSMEYNLDQPDVYLKLYEEGTSVIFCIHHINSTYTKTIKNTIERTGQAHTELIKNQINGLCEFYIKADFGATEFARINVWNGKTREPVPIGEFKGVEYQLIFK